MAQDVTQQQGTAPARQGGEGGADRTRARAVFRPRTDIYETAEGVVLLAEMPGVAPDAVDITLEKRVLTIVGRGREAVHEGYRQAYAEYADGDYERSFTLSEDIDGDNIQATLERGVLRLLLPKAGPAKARKIDLKTA
ncbi:MAG: Hsp20/alpha crystallin family protein [Sphingomonadaceae bacterium]|nr:Hsp20/alpha crystallin family protein [Sphingomonadaceae bacterium]